MAELFSYENIKETLTKKPLVLYFCPPGACGPEGLFFVLFDDKSLYGYLVNHKNTDHQLIKNIIEYIPELKSLLGGNGNYQYKREKYIDDYYLIYLGLGNVGLIKNERFNAKNAVNGQYSYPNFIKEVSEYANQNIANLYQEIKEALNGHI